jgi:dUTP pyrophosphatase
MINANQILELNLLKLETSKGKPAQIGYDLSLKEVNKIGKQSESGQIGRVYRDSTKLATYTKVEKADTEYGFGWILTRGAYDVTFWEGCKIPANYAGFIRQRSSMLRNGALLQSSVFDPGFETDNIGTVLIVLEDIFIEEDARIGQIYFHECGEVSEDSLYNGQWAFDKQRGQ